MLDTLASVSKYRQPMLPRVLQRERLFKRLRDNLDKNLWLIIGQAAQGKTTLISAWAALSPAPTAWLKVEPEDAPIENLFISLVNSLSVALGEDLSRLISEADLGSRPQLSEGELLHMARLVFQAAPIGTRVRAGRGEPAARGRPQLPAAFGPDKGPASGPPPHRDLAAEPARPGRDDHQPAGPVAGQ